MEIQVKNLSKDFIQAGETITVLRRINATFERNHSYALTGASGSGKSTLLHLLCNLDQSSSGSIEWIKKDNLPPKFGIVFQQDFLIEELNCQENIALAAIADGHAAAKAHNKALELLKLVNLETHANAYPKTLSGGQKMRIALCRALISEPDFLFADEPTGNLDQDTAAQILQLILNLQTTMNMGIIICSHDPLIFNQLQSVFKLEHGQLIQLK